MRGLDNRPATLLPQNKNTINNLRRDKTAMRGNFWQLVFPFEVAEALLVLFEQAFHVLQFAFRFQIFDFHAFRRAARDTGVSASSHDLRHHCASLLISAGCSVKAVQAFLGHKNASETLDTYGHLWPGDEDRIRAAIDAGLRGNVHGMCTDAASEALEVGITPAQGGCRW